MSKWSFAIANLCNQTLTAPAALLASSCSSVVPDRVSSGCALCLPQTILGLGGGRGGGPRSLPQFMAPWLYPLGCPCAWRDLARIYERLEMMASAWTQKPAVFMPVKEEVVTVLLKMCMFYIIHCVCVYTHMYFNIRRREEREKLSNLNKKCVTTCHYPNQSFWLVRSPAIHRVQVLYWSSEGQNYLPKWLYNMDLWKRL